MTEDLYQDWNGSIWVNYEKFSYEYNENNNQIEKLRQNWDGFVWMNTSKQSYTYDGNNNLIESLGHGWDGSAWVISSKSSYTYAPATAMNDDWSSINSFSLSNNFPNPFNPLTKISYTIPKRSNVNIKVFNLLGSEVSELVNGEVEAGSYDIEFNAANLPSGVYFYRIHAGSFIDTKKMLLLK